MKSNFFILRNAAAFLQGERMPLKMLKEFLRLESASGLVLMAAATGALVVVNSPLGWIYDRVLHINLTIELAGYGVDKPILLWINDGLMALFFLLVGLEIKREVLEGQLSSRSQAVLPLVAALGGLAMPALLYFLIAGADSETVRGWAIPAATDIAFALGVISLLGRRVPESLKVSLVALAIIDDLAAIVIIALFYTGGIAVGYLAAACCAAVVLFVLNRLGVSKLGAYLTVGMFLWFFVLKSGVHATLAGVITALAIPLGGKDNQSPLKRLEHGLHPWVAFGILPVFAFANAGVTLGGFSPKVLLEPVTAGIATGLFAGKQLGVLAATGTAAALGICSLPQDVSWKQYYGMALLTGIGFTMSLFIGNLAFESAKYFTSVRVGVISGSLLSGALGYLVLRMASNKKILDE